MEETKTICYVFSEYVEDYIITRSPYAGRENPNTNRYLRRFKNVIMKEFGNQCAICGQFECNLEWDHLLIPSSFGGSYLLKHREGYWVNNVIPLCRSCNSSKGIKRLAQVCSNNKKNEILKINAQITEWVNYSLQYEQQVSHPILTIR